MANITLKGNPVTTIGSLPAVGTKLKDFTLVDSDMSNKSLTDFAGKKKIISIFPSVGTGICATSVRHFNEEANKLNNTVIINVSKDLPYALKQFCGAEGLDHVKTLSDFRGSFGTDYGVTMMDNTMAGLLSRAIIVADENNTILYTEQVPEIAQEPNYDAAIAALK
jgi:thiol peroxidase